MLIAENQLDEWVRGNSREAQGVIVELVWRLVAASCPKPKIRRFPLGDSIGQHGPDGILDTGLGYEPFVPEGDSIWEIGTGRSARTKASSDYDDRVGDIPGDVRARSTFVFVTPLSAVRDWEHTWKRDDQAAWLSERRERHDWRGVRVIDGTTLVDWVSRFLPVELWLAQRMQALPAHQIETAGQRWALVKTYGEPPPLTPRLFLTNRDEACGALKKVFDGSTGILKLATHFPNHLVDFVAAYVTALDNEPCVEASGQCLIVSGSEAWNTIVTQHQGYVLVADPRLDLAGDGGTVLIQKARRAGHAVVYAGPQGGIPDPSSVPLQSPRGHQVQEALEEAGYPEERARVLAQKSGENLGSLLRCLQNLSVMPEWAEGSAASELAIAAALGSWNESTDADRGIVEDVGGKAYGEWIGRIREIAQFPGTPLVHHDGIWRFRTRYEGWYALGPRIFDEHLDRLRTAAISVLTERDPRFDLPRDERYAASVHGKVLSHSQQLRQGLAESLALLGSHPKALTSCTVGKSEATAVLAVRGVLAGADWLRWASVNDPLPLMAEAAPAEFLDAVENALQSDPCPFDEVFAQEGDGVTGQNYMTGLLWALETLAWDGDYIGRVVMCLGELASRDPGGRWANRPANSLTAILLPWLPQTCAPLEKRARAVAALLEEVPTVGWKLLLSLLPQTLGASHGTRRPAWRTIIPDDWRDGVSREEYAEQVALYASMAITAAQNDPERLTGLVRELGQLPPTAHERLLAHLGSDAVAGLPDSEKLPLWGQLVDLVTRHRKFSDAKWAMSREQVDRIAAMADRLAPESPLYRHQRLFTERDFELYEQTGDYEKQRQDLETRRDTAIAEVSVGGGSMAVLALARAVESPWRAGLAYGHVAPDPADSEVLPRLLESAEKPLAHFAGGYVWGRFHSRGWEWVDRLATSEWTPTQIGQFFAVLPFTPETWQRVDRVLGAKEAIYWSKTPANPYHADAGLERAADKLLAHGRSLAAVRCLGRLLHSGQTFSSALAVRALLAALHTSEASHSMDAYELREVIKALQKDASLDPEILLRLEWAYLPLLDRHGDGAPMALDRRLADNPEFFCEVVRLVFRSEKEADAKEDLTPERETVDQATREERKKLAVNGYRLLTEWRTPPGSRDDGTFDGAALTAWLEAVRPACSETGYLGVAMTMVGHVLVYAPPDPDGLWIHRDVAAVLNAKAASDMRVGFSTELYNLRGVHVVDPTGTPERELARKYRSQAEEVERAGHVRLATTLRELAATYDREAERASSQEHFNE